MFICELPRFVMKVELDGVGQLVGIQVFVARFGMQNVRRLFSKARFFVRL